MGQLNKVQLVGAVTTVVCGFLHFHCAFFFGVTREEVAYITKRMKFL